MSSATSKASKKESLSICVQATSGSLLGTRSLTILISWRKIRKTDMISLRNWRSTRRIMQRKFSSSGAPMIPSLRIQGTRMPSQIGALRRRNHPTSSRGTSYELLSRPRTQHLERARDYCDMSDLTAVVLNKRTID